MRIGRKAEVKRETLSLECVFHGRDDLDKRSKPSRLETDGLEKLQTV